jgi:hypothetical protein
VANWDVIFTGLGQGVGQSLQDVWNTRRKALASALEQAFALPTNVRQQFFQTPEGQELFKQAQGLFGDSVLKAFQTIPSYPGEEAKWQIGEIMKKSVPEVFKQPETTYELWGVKTPEQRQQEKELTEAQIQAYQGYAKYYPEILSTQLEAARYNLEEAKKYGDPQAKYWKDVIDALEKLKAGQKLTAGEREFLARTGFVSPTVGGIGTGLSALKNLVGLSYGGPIGQHVYESHLNNLNSTLQETLTGKKTSLPGALASFDFIMRDFPAAQDLATKGGIQGQLLAQPSLTAANSAYSTMWQLAWETTRQGVDQKTKPYVTGLWQRLRQYTQSPESKQLLRQHLYSALASSGWDPDRAMEAAVNFVQTGASPW